MKKHVVISCLVAGVLAGCGGGSKQATAPVRATDEGYAKIMEYKNSKAQEFAMVDWDEKLKDIQGASIGDVFAENELFPYDCKLSEELYAQVGNYRLCKIIDKYVRIKRREKVCAAYAKKDPEGEIERLKKAIPGWNGDMSRLQNLAINNNTWEKVEITDFDKHVRLLETSSQYEKCLKNHRYSKEKCYLQYGTGEKVEYRHLNSVFESSSETNGYYLGTVSWDYRPWNVPEYTVAVKKTDLDSEKHLVYNKMYYVSEETTNISGADFPILKKTNVSNIISPLLLSMLKEQQFAKEVQEMCKNLPEQKEHYETVLAPMIEELVPDGQKNRVSIEKQSK